MCNRMELPGGLLLDQVSKFNLILLSNVALEFYHSLEKNCISGALHTGYYVAEPL